MKVLIRRLVFGILSLIAIICVLFVAVPDRQIKSLVITITNALTDRQLHIGAFELERSLRPRLTLTDVAFSNASWSTLPSMFKADGITASVRLPDLLKGQLVVQDLASTGLQLHLEKSVEGDNNWQLSSRPRAFPLPKNLTIVGIAASDILVTYLDRQSDNHQRLAITDVSLQNDESDTNVLAHINGEINTLPVSAVLTMQADESRSQSISDTLGLPYRLEVTAGALEVLAQGHVDGIGKAQRVETDISIEMDSLTQLGKVTNRTLPDIGPVSLEATLAINPETMASSGLQISDLDLAVADPRMRLDVHGEFSGVGAADSGALSLSMDIPDTDPIFTMFNVQRSLPGALSIDASLAGSDGVYDVELQRADFESDFIDAELAGTVADILHTVRADVSVKLDTPDLSLVTQLFGTKMPPAWGPITASGWLQGENGRYAMNNIDATLDGNSRAKASGFIKSLVPFDQMHLDVEANLSTLDEISTFTKKPLPDIGPITGSGVVGWQDGALFLNDARLNHNSQYGIAVVTGNIGDLIHFDKVRLRADADLPDFSALELFTGFALPAVDRVMASTNLISATALDISARQLTVTATRDGLSVVGTGAVESFIKPYIGVDLSLVSQVDSLSQTNTLTGLQLPELGPLQTTAHLKGAGREFSLNDISVTLADQILAGTVTGQLDDLTAFDEMSFDVELKSDDVAVIANEFGFHNSISVPATLETTVSFNDKTLQFNNANIDIQGNRLEGNVTMHNVLDGDTKSRIAADMTLVNVDTRTLFGQALRTRQVISDSGKSAQQASKDTRILPDAPLPIDLLLKDDLDVSLRIDSFSSALLDITDANLEVKVRDRVISIGPFNGTVNQGRFDLNIVVDAHHDPITVGVDVILDEFDLSRTMVFNGNELVDSAGGAWINLSFTGEGVTVAEILGSATGEGGVYIEDLVFQENALAIFSSDLIEQLADALNPFADKKMMGTQLHCSAIMFQLEDGMLMTPFGFATDASDFSVVGEAQVSLKNETMELMFNPRPKTGLGVSLRRLAALVKLEGAIASPSLKLSESGLLQFGASIAAAVASGGVTLLAEGLYNKLDSQSDVCAEALGK